MSMFSLNYFNQRLVMTLTALYRSESLSANSKFFSRYAKVLFSIYFEAISLLEKIEVNNYFAKKQFSS